jgi:2-methylcitrate dehydratase PrpD
MTASKPTQALASFAAGLDASALPSEVREKLLLDFLRVCSIGARLPWSGWARRYVGAVGKAGASHVLYSSDMLNPLHATFMNVTFGSSFDGDDTHVGAMLHPGVAVWSAALAIAEHVGASGSEIVAAVAAGYETAIRIGFGIQPAHFRRGFQSTGTCDVFAAAAAAGRLLFGKAERGILDALGLAGSYPSGVAQFYYSGASGKRIQAAHAAHGGGPPDPAGIQRAARYHRRRRRFCPRLCRRVGPYHHRGWAGKRFHLLDTLVKSHAAAARVAAGIDGMLMLRQQHGFDGNDIETIRVGIPRIIQGRLTNPHPVDLQAAQMCLPFSVALAATVALSGADSFPRLWSLTMRRG